MVISFVRNPCSETEMPFPESRRVIYRSNPLEEVICQLRFPTILRIEAELPAEFQDRVRREYPVFNTGDDKFLPEGLPAEASRILASFGASPTRVYGFASADDEWQVNLNRDFIALTCKNYRRWDQFRGRMMVILGHLVDIYSPSFYTRIGLRYRNLISRKRLGLENEPWSNLFQSHLAAELASDMGDLVQQNKHLVVVVLPNGHGTVRIVHGLASTTGEGETVYLIDNDFFTEERVEPNNAAERLDQFNRYSGGLFRSFIKDRLDKAMGPSSASDA